MPIELSTQLIHASIAAILRDIDPNAEIFDNPTQQGTPYPAWYIVHRQPVERQRECGNRYMLVYGIDIWYMLQQNITRMYDQYTQVAERLQDVMEYLPIYGHPGVLIHTYENSWNLELNAMKYSITLRLRCSRNTVPEPKMQVIEDLRVFIKGLGLLKRIHYTCSQFPDFDMGIETSEYCYEGKSIVLPFVSGVYRDTDNQRWEPIVWDKGPMGGTFGPVTSDTTINLIMGEIVGLDTCIGGTIGVGENVGRDVVWRVQGMTRDSWHYVGRERALGCEPVLGEADLTRAAYKPIGTQKGLAGAPVYGGTVEPYTREKKMYLSHSGDVNVTTSTQYIKLVSDDSGNAIQYDSTKSYILQNAYSQDNTLVKLYKKQNGSMIELNLSTDNVFWIGEYPSGKSGRLGIRRNMVLVSSDGTGNPYVSYFTYITTDA